MRSEALKLDVHIQFSESNVVSEKARVTNFDLICHILLADFSTFLILMIEKNLVILLYVCLQHLTVRVLPATFPLINISNG